GALGASPDQDVAPLIDRQTLALDEFVLQIVQGRVIELELALEGAVGQAAAPLQHGNRLVENLLKGHRRSSLRRCGVQRYGMGMARALWTQLSCMWVRKESPRVLWAIRLPSVTSPAPATKEDSSEARLIPPLQPSPWRGKVGNVSPAY